jgi:hypothetical protein
MRRCSSSSATWRARSASSKRPCPLPEAAVLRLEGGLCRTPSAATSSHGRCVARWPRLPAGGTRVGAGGGAARRRRELGTGASAGGGLSRVHEAARRAGLDGSAGTPGRRKADLTGPHGVLHRATGRSVVPPKWTGRGQRPVWWGELVVLHSVP